MKSRSKFRPSDNRQRRLGFALPQLERLEDRLQPSTVLSGQEWAFLSADVLEPGPDSAALHNSGPQPLGLIYGQEQKPLLPNAAAAAPSPSGSRSSDYGAVAQPALPAQPAPAYGQNPAPAVTNAAALSLGASAKALPPSTVTSSPTTVSGSLGSHPLTELSVGIHVGSQVSSQLSPVSTHSVPQQIHPASAQNWVTYVTGTSFIASGQAVTVDTNGNAYVTGYVNEGTGKEAFVAVYDPNGDTPPIFFAPFQAVDVGANGSGVVHYTNSEGTGIALDATGNIYVVGTAINPKTKAQEAFVMRFENTGNTTQPYALDPTYGIGINSVGINIQTFQPEYLNVNGNGIVVGPDGTATIVGTGNFQDQSTFTIHQDIFLLQINPAGVVATLPDGHPYAFGFAPASFGTDSQGNSYTGTLGNGIAMSPDGSTGYISGTVLDGSANSLSVVVSFTLANADTGVGASFRGTPDGPISGSGIAVGADGTVYQAATGSLQENGQTSAYPSVFGWSADLSTEVTEGVDDSLPGGLGTSIAVDPTGNIYLTGSALDPSGVQRAFVDFLQPAGGQLSANDQYFTGQTPVGTGQESGWGIAYSNANNTVFLIGDTSSTNLSTDTTTLNTTQQDAFLANIGNFGT